MRKILRFLAKQNWRETLSLESIEQKMNADLIISDRSSFYSHVHFISFFTLPKALTTASLNSAPAWLPCMSKSKIDRKSLERN